MDWRVQAACAALTPLEAEPLFFGNNTAARAEGRRVCMACPVRTECLAAADEFEQGLDASCAIGTWAGLSVTERRNRRKATR